MVAVAVSLKLSVTVKLVVVVPAAVGVPLIRPAVDSVYPVGTSFPSVTAAVSGGVPPPNVRYNGLI